jgi:hypothetical protein
MKRILGIVIGLFLLSVLLTACKTEGVGIPRPLQEEQRELYVEMLRTARSGDLTFSVWNVDYRYCLVVQDSGGNVGGISCDTDIWIIPDEER